MKELPDWDVGIAGTYVPVQYLGRPQPCEWVVLQMESCFAFE
jgi:hypothetical protein